MKMNRITLLNLFGQIYHHGLYLITVYTLQLLFRGSLLFQVSQVV